MMRKAGCKDRFSLLNGSSLFALLLAMSCGQGQYQVQNDSAGLTQSGPGGGDGQAVKPPAGDQNSGGNEDDKPGPNDDNDDTEGKDDDEKEPSDVVVGKALPLTSLSSWGNVVSAKEADVLWISEGKATSAQLTLSAGTVSDNVSTSCFEFSSAVGSSAKDYAEPYYPTGLRRCWNVNPTRVVVAERDKPLGETSPRTVFKSASWADLGGLPAGKSFADLAVLGVGEDFYIMGDSKAIVSVNTSTTSVERVIYSVEGLKLPRNPDSVISFTEGEGRSLLLTIGDALYLGRRTSSGSITWVKKTLQIATETPLEGNTPAADWQLRSYLTSGSSGASVTQLILKAGARYYRIDQGESELISSFSESSNSEVLGLNGFLEKYCVSCHGQTHGGSGGLAFKKDGEIDINLLKQSDVKESIRDRVTRAEGEQGRMPASGSVPSQSEIDSFLKELDAL